VRFRTWYVRAFHRESSLETVSREFAKRNFDLVAINEVRLKVSGSQPADDFTFLY